MRKKGKEKIVTGLGILSARKLPGSLYMMWGLYLA
jgi:hypothetical protein